MINDACLKMVIWRGKENMHPALRKRRIIVLDELLFLLLWSRGYIRLKIGLSLSATFSLLIGLGIFFSLLLLSRRLNLVSTQVQRS